MYMRCKMVITVKLQFGNSVYFLILLGFSFVYKIII